ncbi:MAG: hypothetical protein GY913_10485 [Proteobacteria bacterium]|nr:hypothetical protein [Pseudomonadota bacterium]MCP4917340.1 hypothetical protein [Pseudomonadota bacterium]
MIVLLDPSAEAFAGLIDADNMGGRAGVKGSAGSPGAAGSGDQSGSKAYAGRYGRSGQDGQEGGWGPELVIKVESVELDW